jgi:hypothetical protein
MSRAEKNNCTALQYSIQWSVRTNGDRSKISIARGKKSCSTVAEPAQMLQPWEQMNDMRQNSLVVL